MGGLVFQMLLHQNKQEQFDINNKGLSPVVTGFIFIIQNKFTHSKKGNNLNFTLMEIKYIDLNIF